jgi:nucleotide-binding universal stress UspA family protein
MNWFANKKLLVPWDFSEASLNALKTAREMADSLDLVHVTHSAAELSANDPGVVWGTVDDKSRTENLEQHFAEMAGELAEGVTFHVSFGDPGHEIVNKAKEVQADCIVIPSHGRGGIGHMLLGSVAERVVRLSPCPVIVLPIRKS